MPSSADNGKAYVGGYIVKRARRVYGDAAVDGSDEDEFQRASFVRHRRLIKPRIMTRAASSARPRPAITREATQLIYIASIVPRAGASPAPSLSAASASSKCAR